MAAPSPALGIISSAFTAATGLNIHHSDPVANEGESALSSLLGMEKLPPVLTPSFKGVTGGSPARTTQAKYGETQAATAQTKPDVILLSAKDLFGLTYMMMQPPSGTVLEGGMAAVRVHMLKSNVQLTVQVRSSATVKELREDAAKKVGLLPVQLMLIFNNTRLEDYQEIKDHGIISNSTILGMKCCPRPPAVGGVGGVDDALPAGMKLCPRPPASGGGGGDGAIIFKLDPSSLAPRYDYDFTGKADDGKTFHRGNYPYYRPYGWKRYALNVLGDADYKDDKWLGADGIRTEATDGEWPVTYHGTRHGNVWGIVEHGYDPKKEKTIFYGSGIYSSPFLKVVVEDRYAGRFKYEKKNYAIALQNRVNPDPRHLDTHHNNGKYWLSHSHKPENGIFDIRPYGIVIREL